MYSLVGGGNNARGRDKLGRSRRKWEGDIKIFLQGIGWDWIEFWVEIGRIDGPCDDV